MNMMNDRPDPEKLRELQRLISHLGEDELQPDEVARLEELLCTDEACCEYYVTAMQINAALPRYAGGAIHKSVPFFTNDTGASVSNEATLQGEDVGCFSPMLSNLPGESLTPLSFIGRIMSSGGGGIGIPTFFAMLMIAMALTAGSTVWLLHATGVISPERVQLASSQPAITPVAYLTSANGCAWGGDSVKTWTIGHSIESGSEIALHEGIAEFRLANGVSLGIEGPASLLLTSPSKLVLQYGKVTAHVPWGTEDFKVVLAGCRIMARDAEFGLSLSGNKLDIHVFSGEVAAASSIASGDYDDEEFVVDNNYFSDAIIESGRSLRLMAQGEVLRVVGWGKAAAGQFVSKLSMSGPLAVTQEYVDQIRSAKPISYWRFEQIVDSRIPNEIDPDLPLVVEDRAELVGTKGNLSAEFRWDDYWQLKTKKRLSLVGSDYSIEAWIKPSHVHMGSVFYLDCKDGVGSSARIELQGGAEEHLGKTPGVLRYVHRMHKDRSDWRTSCYSSVPYAIRRWQHVVAVKTKTDMKLFLDGKLVARADEEVPVNANPYLIVGLLKKTGSDMRKFIGQLDELAIYNRVLSEKEISRHYKLLKKATAESKPAEEPKQATVSSREV